MLNELAKLHAATSFLNSFFLEWKEVKYDSGRFRFSVGVDEIIIPVKKHSLVGRHVYEGKFYIKTLEQDLKEVSFFEILSRVSDHIGSVLGTPEEQKKNFIQRVINSTFNLEKIISSRLGDLENIRPHGLDFALTEQLLYAGHTCHPTPKARGEFSDYDAEKYSPEFKGSFPLRWIGVHESLYRERSSSSFNQKEWLQEIFRSEVHHELPAGFVPFPLHPFQEKVLLRNPDFASYIEDGLIMELNESVKKWIPTSSVRTLYRRDCPFMLKFSLSVKLTNSMRNLLSHELDRGLVLHDVLETQRGKEFLRRYPYFHLIHEPVFGGLIARDGTFIKESLLLGRANPFREKEQVLPVATLAMNDVHFGSNLIHKFIARYAQRSGKDLKEAACDWFRKFLEVAIHPLIVAASEYGILLGSHQQNMLIEMKDDLPHSSFFRDCNGTGFTVDGGKAFSASGIILEEEPASYLFGYYVIINTTFNVLSAVAQDGVISEAELLRLMRSSLEELKASTLTRNFLVDYLLNSEELMHKGNFLCSFRNINENTEDNPLSIYTRIKNPLKDIV